MIYIESVLVYLAIAISLVYYTNVHYHAVMNLKRNKDKLSKSARIFNFPILIIGLVFDALLTVLVGTIVFLDLPRELTLTSRLKRYSKSSRWRGKVARWICHNLLDWSDPSGKHC